MTQNRLVDDCFEAASGLMRHDDAVDLLRQRTVTVVGSQGVQLNEASGRTVVARIAASHDVPAHNNAAVDGYAFAFDGVNEDTETTLRIIGRAAAGRPFNGKAELGEAVRIFTGAVVPQGCDSVIMQEDVTADDDGQRVTLPKGVRAGANIRPAGEDLKAHQTLYETGHRLRPQDLATLASIGVGHVQCFERLKVGIISTGDEVIAAGTRPLKTGEVFDANTPMLDALVTLSGAKATNLGIWPDRPDVVQQRLRDAATSYDVLLTSGGASQGEEDHLAAAVAALGQRHFWQIAVKPGRPMMFGQIGDVPIIGLPGNPVAVFVCFLMYVAPLLRVLGGGKWHEPRRIYLPAAFTVTKRKPRRREFWRGGLVSNQGETLVDKYPRDGSGLISSLRQSDGLIDMPDDGKGVAEGDTVAFIPYSEFGILS